MGSDARRQAFATDEELLTREDAKHLVRRLWALLGPYHLKIYGSVGLIAFWTACLLAGPALVKHGIDAGLRGKDEGALDLSAGLYLGVAIFGLAFGRFAIWAVSKSGTESLLFASLARKPLRLTSSFASFNANASYSSRS